jgi:uncharacterized protein
MIEAALQFSDADVIGRVGSVDTSRVAIDVTNSNLLTRIGIGQLIAIRGATEREYLIAITERVTRSIRDNLPSIDESGENESLLDFSPSDLVQAVLIGTNAPESFLDGGRNRVAIYIFSIQARAPRTDQCLLSL